jgi:hypothetical protein
VGLVGIAEGTGVGAEGTEGTAVGTDEGAVGNGEGLAVGPVTVLEMARLRILAAAASYQGSLAYTCTEGQVS